jgi:hypothetical protein
MGCTAKRRSAEANSVTAKSQEAACGLAVNAPRAGKVRRVRSREVMEIRGWFRSRKLKAQSLSVAYPLAAGRVDLVRPPLESLGKTTALELLGELIGSR